LPRESGGGAGSGGLASEEGSRDGRGRSDASVKVEPDVRKEGRAVSWLREGDTEAGAGAMGCWEHAVCEEHRDMGWGEEPGEESGPSGEEGVALKYNCDALVTEVATEEKDTIVDTVETDREGTSVGLGLKEA
jgi:hypothetical protein